MKLLASNPAARRVSISMRIVCDAPIEEIQATAEEIARKAATISGGATLMPIRGLWATDASQDLDRYRGPFELADGIAIEITVPLERAEELRAALPSIVGDACRRSGLPARWIHTDIDTRLAAHFEIDPVSVSSEPPLTLEGDGHA